MGKQSKYMLASVIIVLVCVALVILATSIKKTIVLEKERTAQSSSQDVSPNKTDLPDEYIVESSSNESTESTSEDDEKIILTVLNNFGEKWVNYDTIFKRNQSVKSLLTNNAINENAIDVDPQANFEGKGKINHIYKSTKNDDTYVLIGEETANNNWNKVLLEVTVDRELLKLNKIVVNYMRQGY